MTRTRFAALAFALSAVAPAVAQDAAPAADAKAARALVEKAVAAHGGADTVGKFKASVVTFKGTFHGMGMMLPLTGEISTDGPDRARAELEIEAGGQKIPILNVVNGDKGWTRVAGQTKELGRAELATARDSQHAGYVASLAPLVKGTGYSLATAGELLVNDKAALGVKVTAADRRPVTLYFDKESGLVVRYDTVVVDEATGREVTEETTVDGHADVQGTKQARRLAVRRDGALYIEGEVTAQQLSESLADGLFARP